MSEKSPHVAVLMTACNGMAFIGEQLHSIKQQKNVDITIFISVDISTDGTYEWCCNYAQQHLQVEILSYGDKFGGAAPNFFRLIKDVDFSCFDYVALADQDDIWFEDKLNTACKQIKNNDLAGYSSNVLAFWDDGRELPIKKSQPQRKYDYLFEAAGPGCTYVMRVGPLIEMKKMLTTHWQLAKQVTLHDWLIYAFFRVNNYKWLTAPDYKMLYRQHNNNQVGVHKGWKSHWRRLKLLKNGWYKQQVVLISQLTGEQTPIVNSRLILLQNSNQLRRRQLDRVLLFFVVLIGLF